MAMTQSIVWVEVGEVTITTTVMPTNNAASLCHEWQRRGLTAGVVPAMSAPDIELALERQQAIEMKQAACTLAADVINRARDRLMPITQFVSDPSVIVACQILQAEPGDMWR